MDIRTRFKINIPESLMDSLGIDENTVFAVKYSNGELRISPIIDYEAEDGEAEDELLYSEDYEEGFDEGYCEGYIKGYRAGFEDAECGDCYNDTWVEAYNFDCDYECRKCNFNNKDRDCCEAR